MAATLVALSGCSFDADLVPGYQCGEGDSCPAGQFCVDGYCEIDPAEHDASVLDAPPDGAIPAGRCGTLSLLQDDFGDDTFEWYWDAWDDPGAVVVETGGAAVIQIAAGGGDPWAGITAARWYDLRDGAFEAEVLEVGGFDTVIEVRNHLDESAQLLVEDKTRLVAAVYGIPDDGVRIEIPYQPATHHFWRLRESGSTLFWETSSDRAEWTAFHSEPLPFEVEHVRGMLAAGGQLNAASQARFGDVNLGAPGGLAFCPASDLVDDFDDGQLAPHWDPYTDPGCSIIDAGTDLFLVFDGIGDDNCGVLSEHLFDLRDSAFTIDAGDAPGGATVFTYIQVGLPDDSATRLEIERQGNELDVEQQLAGVDVTNTIVPYDGVDHRWWRIRGAGGKVYLDASPDGSAWTNILEDDSAFDLSAVRLEIGAGTTAPGPGAPVMLRFDRVN